MTDVLEVEPSLRRPRRTRPATVAEVNAMRSKGRHSIGDSLILAVAESGSRSWVARVRDPMGKRRDIGLGPFADLTLAEARTKARDLRRAGRDGEAILTRSERRKATRAVPTFREAAKLVHAERKGAWRNGKHQDQWINTLEHYAFPKLGDMTVDAISGGHVIEVLAAIWLTKPETARRLRQRVMAVLSWAHAREYRTAQLSPATIAAGLGTQAKRGNHAALPYVEVPALAEVLRGKDTMGSMALEFLLLTAARSGEVRGATWAEIDLDKAEWTIPASRMKAKREHVVPLTERAVAIVKAAQAVSISDTIVFPGPSGKAMSDMTMAKALRAAGVLQDRGLVHGLRSSFRDWVSEETQFPSDVAEAALAHTIRDKTEAAYRRGKLLAKRREMMTAWANYCDGKGAAVVRIAA